MFVSNFKDHGSGPEKRVIRLTLADENSGKNLGDKRGQGYILENHGRSGRGVKGSTGP